jgi:aspartate aminotransferase-like enzyme
VSKDGRLTGFHDWLNVNNYASDARNRLTQWGYDIRAKVDHVYFLTGSPILRMGIAVASIVLKEMLIVFTDRGAFEQELRAALRERRNAAAQRVSDAVSISKS